MQGSVFMALLNATFRRGLIPLQCSICITNQPANRTQSLPWSQSASLFNQISLCSLIQNDSSKMCFGCLTLQTCYDLHKSSSKVYLIRFQVQFSYNNHCHYCMRTMDFMTRIVVVTAIISSVCSSIVSVTFYLHDSILNRNHRFFENEFLPSTC